MSQVLSTSVCPFKTSRAPRSRGASQQRFWTSEAGVVAGHAWRSYARLASPPVVYSTLLNFSRRAPQTGHSSSGSPATVCPQTSQM